MTSSTWLRLLLVVSMAGNAYLLYKLIDHGVSITYQADEQARRGQQLAALSALLMEYAKGDSRNALVQRAKQVGLHVIDKPGENYFWIDEIRFDIVDDRLADIKLD